MTSHPESGVTCEVADGETVQVYIDSPTESSLPFSDTSQLDPEGDASLGEDARLTQLRYLRDIFRDMVVDHTYFLSSETIKLLPIIVNGIIQLYNEKDQQVARQRKIVRDAGAAQTMLKTDNKGLINFLKVDNASLREIVRQLRTTEVENMHRITQLQDEESKLRSENDDLRDQVVRLRQTVTQLQPGRGSLLDALGPSQVQDVESSKKRKRPIDE
ncbi:hypothetical protein OIDMADRAFT_61451 [Oidiodendron maius Zn]|uniref:Uncharacterized protein n=1 Tax=Oidiodendron maius (strain Zn) TaxID=913774 RepID=A0A0C3CUX1_OIDMZ|nr:hypothetical protein OIDMADRAFT_61451 [Oidiodendron maius Zn]